MFAEDKFVGPPAPKQVSSVKPEANFWGFLTQAGTVAATAFQKYTQIKTTEKQSKMQLKLAQQQLKQGIVPNMQFPIAQVPIQNIPITQMQRPLTSTYNKGSISKNLPIIILGGAGLLLAITMLKKKRG